MIQALKNSLAKVSDILSFKDTRASRRNTIIVLVLLGVWLALVIFTEARHEFWRDEVRALSLVRQASSPLDLINQVKYEGHPILWYLLLYVGYTVTQSQLVLPVLAVSIGFAAVVLFMVYARLPLWFKTLFIFSALPIYEYSVMARNYGISMLLMFAAASLYRRRSEHPYWLAVSLALLANTNAYSVALAVLLAAVWVWDAFADRKLTTFRQRLVSLYLPLVIVLAGLILSALVALPKDNTIVTTANTGLSWRLVLETGVLSLLRPDTIFEWIVPPTLPGWLTILVFICAILGLIRRPNLFLAAAGAQAAFGIITEIVYEGVYRHEGLFLVFFIMLYWLYAESPAPAVPNRYWKWLNRVGLYGAIGFILCINLALTMATLPADWSEPVSSSKAFGEFLTQSPDYQNAILVAEPDFFMEAVVYYAPNRVYLPREGRFGTTVLFTTASSSALSMHDLLISARELKQNTGQPILIVFGHMNINASVDDVIFYSYDKNFSWTAAEMADFYASTRLIQEYTNAIGGENYRVYELIH